MVQTVAVTPGIVSFLAPTTYTYTGVNLGASNAFSGTNDRIVFKFPVGYDLSGATFFEGTTYGVTEVLGVGNIMIVRLRDTLNSSPQTFTLYSVVSPPVVTVAPTIKAYVVIGHLYAAQYSGATAALAPAPPPTFTTPPVLLLPTHSNMYVPTNLLVTFSA